MYQADHMLTLFFTKTPRKAHFGSPVDNVNTIKFHNLGENLCVKSGQRIFRIPIKIPGYSMAVCMEEAAFRYVFVNSSRF